MEEENNTRPSEFKNRINSGKPMNGSSYDLNGWKYISIRGKPRERGYTYGYYIATDFIEVQKMLNFVVYNDTGEEWQYFIDKGAELLKPTIMEKFSEFYEEIEGITDGINAYARENGLGQGDGHGDNVTTVDEVLAWNNSMTLLDYWYPNRGGDGTASSSRGARGEGGAADRCSAFIAVGNGVTEDGEIVVAHNNFSNFADGQWAHVVVDIYPENGERILMQTFPGWIWSGTDFFVTTAGIIGTETTIGGFLPFENKSPISCRIRQAMQYGRSLDEYVDTLLKDNSGDYANSWLFGDINTKEIMRLELGLKYHSVERTKSGYYIGFNAAYDPRIRNLECTNSGFNDTRRHQGARRVRLEDLMQENMGTINLAVAKKIIADHYDVYLEKEDNPCSRTVCSHYYQDKREYMSDPSRPLPNQPRGALDGCVVDSAQARAMSFELIYGNSCGTPFSKDDFCNEFRQWAYLKPYLHDRPTQPWTIFKIADYGEPEESNLVEEMETEPETDYEEERGGKKKRKQHKPVKLSTLKSNRKYEILRRKRMKTLRRWK